MTRGELARRTGMNPETVRYYEKEGILPKPPRSASGYRIYTNEDLFRVRFIQRAQHLGFALKEIRELLELRADSEAVCGDVRERAEQKLAEVRSRMRSLQGIEQVLSRLVDDCARGGTTGDCPILAALEKEESEDAPD